MATLRASVTHSGDRTEIRLMGTIDQTTAGEFTRAFEELRPTVWLNFLEVVHISSYGIGLLMRQLGAICTDHKVEFWECSETMVDQFQMLEFSSYGRIASFQARYVCTRCDQQDLVLLDIRRDLEVDVSTRTVRSPEYSCSCGGVLVIDDSLDFVVEHV